MRVHVSARLDEGLWALIVERASVEQRTLTNMVERLLTLGLGQMVTDAVGTDGRAAVGEERGSFEAVVTPMRGSAPTASVTVCPNQRFHRSGVFCKACGLVG